MVYHYYTAGAKFCNPFIKKLQNEQSVMPTGPAAARALGGKALIAALRAGRLALLPVARICGSFASLQKPIHEKEIRRGGHRRAQHIRNCLLYTSRCV